MSLRFVIDMNLSPAWVERFALENWEAVHWSSIGDPRATDASVLNRARAESSVVFTHDLDFGAILAATGADGPSVVQVRTQDLTPQHLGPLVMLAIRETPPPSSRAP